jgi:hypothetical protein
MATQPISLCGIVGQLVGFLARDHATNTRTLKGRIKSLVDGHLENCDNCRDIYTSCLEKELKGESSIPPKCGLTRKLIDQYIRDLGGKSHMLKPGERKFVETHLAECSGCSWVYSEALDLETDIILIDEELKKAGKGSSCFPAVMEIGNFKYRPDQQYGGQTL